MVRQQLNGGEGSQLFCTFHWCTQFCEVCGFLPHCLWVVNTIYCFASFIDLWEPLGSHLDGCLVFTVLRFSRRKSVQLLSGHFPTLTRRVSPYLRVHVASINLGIKMIYWHRCGGAVCQFGHTLSLKETEKLLVAESCEARLSWGRSYGDCTSSHCSHAQCV